jgi:hypothetical protein
MASTDEFQVIFYLHNISVQRTAIRHYRTKLRNSTKELDTTAALNIKSYL